MTDHPTRHVRTLFISDVHLGSKAAQADLLLDFLRLHDADTIYLVGDFVDGWRLSRSWHWPQTHNDVVQKLLKKVRKGSRLIYIAGNHDEFLRPFQGVHFGGIVVADRDIHLAADGRRYLVLHGDQFDAVVHNARWIAYVGDRAYDASILVNRGVARVRSTFGLPYWSFSAWAKLTVKRAVSFISQFQDLLVGEARRSDVDGIICGHIHHAAIEHLPGGLTYINTGDWVESCTAVIENFDGGFEIIEWATVSAAKAAARAPAPIEVAAGADAEAA